MNTATAAIFVGLSGYALTTRKDFSFMGGFLMVGILVAFLAGLGAIFFQMPALSLAVSAMFVLLMSGLILYETSNIIRGGETNAAQGSTRCLRRSAIRGHQTCRARQNASA